MENDESDSESENETTELILVPNDDNSSSISSIYEAIKLCQVNITYTGKTGKLNK